MSIPNTIDITTVIFFALLAWAVIVTVVLLDKLEALEEEKAKRRELEETQTADTEVDTTPTEIPENDRDWHIRPYVVEGIRAGIINRLGNTSAVLVRSRAICGLPTERRTPLSSHSCKRDTTPTKTSQGTEGIR